MQSDEQEQGLQAEQLNKQALSSEKRMGFGG
jgi:hypothetical protein